MRLTRFLPSFSCLHWFRFIITGQIDGLVQERRNSIANALELRLSCSNSSKCTAETFCRGLQGSPEAGPWFNIKMSSYQYRKSHCGDKTVVRSSYLHNGISYTGKTTSLYWIRAQVAIFDGSWGSSIYISYECFSVHHNYVLIIKQLHPGWGYQTNFRPNHYFLDFSPLSTHQLPIEYHVHICRSSAVATRVQPNSHRCWFKKSLTYKILRGTLVTLTPADLPESRNKPYTWHLQTL